MKCLSWICVGLVVAMSGCTRTQKPVEQPSEPAPTATGLDRTELGRKADQIAALVQRLPGQNSGENLALTADFFNDMVGILPHLTPHHDGAYQQRILILQISAQKLQTGAEFHAEPTINEGMRAACTSLEAVANERFDQAPEIGAAIDSAGKRVDQMNTTSGASHRLVASQAARELSRAMNLMVEAIEKPADK